MRENLSRAAPPRECCHRGSALDRRGTFRLVVRPVFRPVRLSRSPSRVENQLRVGRENQAGQAHYQAKTESRRQRAALSRAVTGTLYRRWPKARPIGARHPDGRGLLFPLGEDAVDRSDRSRCDAPCEAQLHAANRAAARAVDRRERRAGPPGGRRTVGQSQRQNHP